MNDEQLRLRLASTSPPDEAGAERRAWAVVRAAFTEREPTPKRRPFLKPAIAVAIIAGVVAAAISPPGRAVLDELRDAIAPARIEPSQPALVRLPAAGRLLVDSAAGAWVVRRDGSRRLLGPYHDASWSPHGLFVTAASDRELVALTPEGKVRWSIARNGPITSPRWTGSRTDTRIAYLDGRSLRVVAGDGTDDRLVDRGVTALAWSPASDRHTLAYLKPGGRLLVRDVDTGETLWRARVPAARTVTWSPGGTLAVVSRRRVDVYAPDGARTASLELPGVTAAAYAPDGRRLAVIRTLTEARSEAVVLNRDLTGARRILVGAGDFDSLAWSPDGRRLLVGWPSADQWLFLPARGRARPRAVSDIADQFEPADAPPASFPTIAQQGWCCPP